MMTIMALEVHRRTGRPEFLLGTAASTRDSVNEAKIVGYYINMLPLPCRVRRHESVEQALQTMQSNLAEALQHARYPFALIYRNFRQDERGGAAFGALSPVRFGRHGESERCRGRSPVAAPLGRAMSFG